MCPYHAIKRFDKVGFMEVSFAKRIIDKLKSHESKVLLNGAGESLLHPQFHEIARYAVEIGIPYVHFNTNGMLANKEFVDEFISYFRGEISFSIDGFKESCERIRTGASYDVIEANLLYLLEQREAHNLPIAVRINCSHYDQPPEEIERFKDYWLNKVDSITISKVFDHHFRLSEADKGGYQRVVCKIPWETFIVRWNGTAVPCCVSMLYNDHENIILGNAMQDELESIWLGDAFKSFRTINREMRLKGTICENCDEWNVFIDLGKRESDGIVIESNNIVKTYRKAKGCC
jgi:MoaA/NifB/PqqE/SkfB family radical SAM enzyme